jgi:RNA polymerase sigma-54 factor
MPWSNCCARKGFDLARRTVAKYREAIGLGSSIERRRRKALAAVR